MSKVAAVVVTCLFVLLVVVKVALQDQQEERKHEQVLYPCVYGPDGQPGYTPCAK